MTAVLICYSFGPLLFAICYVSGFKVFLKWLLKFKKNSQDKELKMPDYEFPLVSFATGKESEDIISSSLIQLYATVILNSDR